MKGICFRLGDNFLFNKYMTTFEEYFQNMFNVIKEKGVFEYTTSASIRGDILGMLDSVLFMNTPDDVAVDFSAYLCTDVTFEYNEVSGNITFYIKDIKKVSISDLENLYPLKTAYHRKDSIAKLLPTYKRTNRFYWYS